MGCSSSAPVESGDVLHRQYRLMCAAQSEGLFCDAPRALRAVRALPQAGMHDLLQSIREELRPLPPAQPPRDPRQLSAAALLQAANALATASDERRNEDTNPPPINLADLDEVAPALLPSELPESLTRGVTSSEASEKCAICACELLEDAPTGGLARPIPIRQLGCSHAFHSLCIDPWLTNQEASCPVCRARVEPPAEAWRKKERTSGYDRWRHAKSAGVEGELRAHAAAREAEWNRLDREEAAREAARRSVASGPGFF